MRIITFFSELNSDVTFGSCLNYFFEALLGYFGSPKWSEIVYKPFLFLILDLDPIRHKIGAIFGPFETPRASREGILDDFGTLLE